MSQSKKSLLSAAKESAPIITTMRQLVRSREDIKRDLDETFQAYYQAGSDVSQWGSVPALADFLVGQLAEHGVNVSSDDLADYCYRHHSPKGRHVVKKQSKSGDQ